MTYSTYKEASDAHDSLRAADTRASNTDKSYANSGRMDTNQAAQKAAQDAMTSFTLDINSLTPEDALQRCQAILATGDGASCLDMDKQPATFIPPGRDPLAFGASGNWKFWLAETVRPPRGIVIIGALDDAQKAIRCLPDGIDGYSVSMVLDDCGVVLRIGDNCCSGSGLTQAVAMVSAIAAYRIVTAELALVVPDYTDMSPNIVIEPKGLPGLPL